jgi:hypothetical protein
MISAPGLGSGCKRGRLLPFSCFGGTEGVWSSFQVLYSRTRFWRYRGRRLPSSSFALPDSCSAVPRASFPVVKFCAPVLVFGSIEGVGSHFHDLCARTHFRRYRGCRIPFSCFARPDSFSVVPRASGLIFKFCALRLIFGGTDGVVSHFHVLRAQTRFRRYRGRSLPFLCFALRDSFSAVPRASGTVFKFCVPRLISGCTEGVCSRFHVSAVPRASGLVFKFCTPGLGFGGTEGVGSRLHLLRSWNRVPRYRGRRSLLSSFARSYSFSVVPRASDPIFMFCALGLIFGGTEGVRSHFQVLCARTHFRRYQRRRVPFSCFARTESFSAVPRASAPIFMFYAPGIVFDGTEGVGSRFQILRTCTNFRRYRARRVPFSCFALPVSFPAVPRESVPVFMFYAPGLVFDGTEGVGCRFQILRT